MLINLNIEIKHASEADVKRLAEAVSVAMCATPVTVTAPEEPAPAPEEGGSDEGLLDVAVKRATALLAEGDTTPVKEALKAAGARRVSQLKGDAIQVFLDALPQEA